ncbi:SRPBCC family protein [Methylomarinum sp. Ch1-1]|uniref:SRPBCC family protein n=1 Tax=Methylomarinum roseum TaxID=3067653 RepID=A0AAU7NRJ0_9GAMM|nr:SRPBCC family protein [Methylomarinum sp. Ch1-1]MDP4520463.1 SRPBCC family protein [Methylomarinum sp. Ch1-1]
MPQCYQSIVVDAPIEKVWDTIEDFHDMSWAESVIQSCEAVGDQPGTAVGAKRVLNNVFHETLLECSHDDFRIRYSIDDGPSPVSPTEISNYVGQIQLKPVTLGGTTFVEWRSSWESASEEARDFCHQIYIALLKALAEEAAKR